MITFEAAPDHVLATRAQGRLTQDDISALVTEIDARFARHEKIGVVTDITGLEGMTLDAIFEDLRAEWKYLGDWDRFPKVALIADKGFLKSVASTVDKLIPQVDVAVFPSTERDKAFAFAALAGSESGDGLSGGSGPS